jgi:hypothetical protein
MPRREGKEEEGEENGNAKDEAFLKPEVVVADKNTTIHTSFALKKGIASPAWDQRDAEDSIWYIIFIDQDRPLRINALWY